MSVASGRGKPNPRSTEPADFTRVFGFPKGVSAGYTTRNSPGASLAPYQHCNLATHVGDQPATVEQNRSLLSAFAELPSPPRFLRQVHGIDVITIDANSRRIESEADAAISRTPGVVLAVLTGDCLPILVADDAGTAVAAIHAGWRGLASGVIERCIAQLAIDPARLSAWIGPAIGPVHYEIGDEVRTGLLRGDGGGDIAFERTRPGHFRCDLPLLARRRLGLLGVSRVTGGDLCTYHDARFYSYRRDGVTGRFASLIWIAPNP